MVTQRTIQTRTEIAHPSTKISMIRLALTTRSPTGRLEAGAPSAIEVVGTRYASPTGRLEAGAPSVAVVVRTGHRERFFFLKAVE